LDDPVDLLHPTHRLQRLLIQKKPNWMSLPLPPHSYLAMSAPLQHSLHRHLSRGPVITSPPFGCTVFVFLSWGTIRSHLH
jgi:hypothetical protein